MTPGAVVHIFIALVWMFLSGNTTLGGLILGLLAGFALIALFRKALGCEDYVRRLIAATCFIGKFAHQVVLSNVRLAKAALRHEASHLEGEFVTYSIKGMSDTEVLLLCQCISLTPGTIVAEKLKESDELILHAFASGSADEIRQSIDEGMKHPILSFTR